MNRPDMTVRAFLESLRRGAFTSVGCYPLFWLCSDGGVLSHAACKANVWEIARAIRDGSNCGWRVVAQDVNWEDPDMYCDDTGERIESAYAEDQAEEALAAFLAAEE